MKERSSSRRRRSEVPPLRGTALRTEVQLELFADDDLTSSFTLRSLVAGRSPEATAGDVSALKPVRKKETRSV